MASPNPPPSIANADRCRNFISPLHKAPYAEIDAIRVKVSLPYVVCIIGGGGAAGSGLARSYARAGVSGLVLASRSKPDATAAEVNQINPNIKVVTAKCDITSNADVEALAETVKLEFGGRLDVAVVNCGYSGPLEKAKVTEEDPYDVQMAFNVNAVGTWHAAHHLLPLLLATESGARSFIAISSMAMPNIAGFGATSNYCASKLAQARITEMIHTQYALEGLFCANLHPGGLQSEFSKNVPSQFQKFLDDDPDLVGSVCVWLTKSSNSEEQRKALNGRFISCKWDVTELGKEFGRILDKDLLRIRVAVE